MSLQSLPSLAIALLGVMLAIALSFGFFVGRTCAPSTSHHIEDRAIEKERAKRHADIEREMEAKRRVILERAKGATTQKLRKDLLEGAKP